MKLFRYYWGKFGYFLFLYLVTLVRGPVSLTDKTKIVKSISLSGIRRRHRRLTSYVTLKLPNLGAPTSGQMNGT